MSELTKRKREIDRKRMTDDNGTGRMTDGEKTRRESHRERYRRKRKEKIMEK